MDSKDANRYVFGLTGTVREIIYPSKAILSFRFNGKDEKAILLVHKLILASSGNAQPAAVDEHRLMSDLVKVGDILEFDGHVYDKGGFGAGKDKCNYYVMRAWKACQSKLISRDQMASGKSSRPQHMVGTGWISEVFPRKGVLTFTSPSSGEDERVLFLASKVYIFEKRLGTKQSLDQVLTEGDPVQFEAVPQDSTDNSHFCSWFASLVWKGKRPAVEDPNLGPASIKPLGVADRRGSIGSTGSSESNSTEGSSDSSGSSPLNSQQQRAGGGTAAAAPPSTLATNQSEQIVRGQGFIGRVVNESYGLIWWVLQPNHLQSVWFERKHAFLATGGLSLANQDLREIFKQGDPVQFVAGRSTAGPTNWVARQVLSTTGTTTNGSILTNNSLSILERLKSSVAHSSSFGSSSNPLLE